MVRRGISLFMVCIFLSLIPGCWDYKDLDEMSMPIVGIYDVVKEDNNTNDKVIVGGIFPVLEQDADEKYIVEFIQGQTLSDTREKRSHKSSLSYSIGLLDAAIWGEEITKQGINKYSILDNLARTPIIKNTLYMAILEGDIKELKNLKVKQTRDPALFILGILKEANQNSFLPSITLHEFAVNTYTTGKNPILPMLKMKDHSGIEIVGTGIFKEDKFIAKIGLEETRSLILLRTNKSIGNISFIIERDGEIIDEGAVTVKKTRKVKVTRDGNKYTFNVTIKLKGHLLERLAVTSFFEENTIVTIEDIEKAIKEEIEKDCTEFIKKMQNEFKVDCIDITKYALAKWRNELMDKVEENFIENAEINVNVEVTIDSLGDLT
ncbi:MAG: Ger(x)C family spore germination protein [Clostridia bacterium]|nr:Ger(x)C family spore germination protein [Clostridia bacterium]